MDGIVQFETITPSVSNSGDKPPITPTSSTELQDERIPYNDLLLQYAALQSSNNALQSTIATLRSRNDYWTKLYTYVEKGLTIKKDEMNALRQENQQLKETNSKLTHQVETLSNNNACNLIPPSTSKRIQQLEDQIRARDLVINLMREADKERTEKEIREKLDQQRQQLEQELTTHIGPQPATRENPKRAPQSEGRGRKSTERLTISPQRSKARGQKRKLSLTRNGARNRGLGKSPIPSEIEVERTSVNEREEILDGTIAAVDEEAQVETEFNDALEELFRDTASEA